MVSFLRNNNNNNNNAFSFPLFLLLLVSMKRERKRVREKTYKKGKKREFHWQHAVFLLCVSFTGMQRVYRCFMFRCGSHELLSFFVLFREYMNQPRVSCFF
mmetsp:Transcript_7466/g.11495  ORF Transcript_7466/g.11495 Transcript_7466/m.11495 type:complete len:101 (+) Transcript_7466:507-809(+)